MTKNQEVLKYLRERRSVTLPFLSDPGPSFDEIEELAQIATRVPDHGKLAPWRLIRYRGDDRAIIGEKLAAIWQSKNLNANEEQLEKERNQFLPAPITFGVLSSPKEHFKIPQSEQYLSAACVAFNLVHAANAMGYGAHWVTRWFAYDQDAATMLGATEGETFVGFVHIGTAQTRLEERSRPALEDVVSDWRAP